MDEKNTFFDIWYKPRSQPRDEDTEPHVENAESSEPQYSIYEDHKLLAVLEPLRALEILDTYYDTWYIPQPDVMLHPNNEESEAHLGEREVLFSLAAELESREAEESLEEARDFLETLHVLETELQSLRIQETHRRGLDSIPEMQGSNEEAQNYLIVQGFPCGVLGSVLALQGSIIWAQVYLQARMSLRAARESIEAQEHLSEPRPTTDEEHDSDSSCRSLLSAYEHLVRVDLDRLKNYGADITQSRNEVNIEEFKYEKREASKDLKTEECQQECSICYLKYEEGDILRRLPCTHEFHKDCIDEWFTVKRICPYCRRYVRRMNNS